MLHLDGEGYFLLVCVWRNTNELWQVLYGRDDTGFHPYPPKDGALRPNQNIFELDATAHERRAWSRFLTSARDEAARAAYVADRCTGVLVWTAQDLTAPRRGPGTTIQPTGQR